MTVLTWYVFVGLPAILLLMGYGAIKLADHDARKMDERAARKGE